MAHALAYTTAEERDELALVFQIRACTRVFSLGSLLGPLFDALALLARRLRRTLVRWLSLPSTYYISVSGRLAGYDSHTYKARLLPTVLALQGERFTTRQSSWETSRWYRWHTHGRTPRPKSETS